MLLTLGSELFGVRTCLPRDDCWWLPLHHLHFEVWIPSPAWESVRQLLQVQSFLARRVAHNQLTLLGLSSCSEILVLNLSMFTEPKIRSESSDLSALRAVHVPETAKSPLAALFVVGSRRRPM